MLHRSCDYATIKGNEVFDNGDAGVALYESMHAKVTGNTFKDNKCEFGESRTAQTWRKFN